MIRLLACGLLSALLTGCVTELEPGQEPMSAPPRDVPAQPSGLVVNHLTLSPQVYPLDRNANGMGDTIVTVVYLWSQPYPHPLHRPGTLTFSLYPAGAFGRPDAQPSRTWSFAGAELDAHRDRTIVGPCYYFELSAFNPVESGETGSAQYLQGDFNLKAGDLVVAFTDAQESGKTIVSGVSTVQLDKPIAR